MNIKTNKNQVVKDRSLWLKPTDADHQLAQSIRPNGDLFLKDAIAVAKDFQICQPFTKAQIDDAKRAATSIDIVDNKLTDLRHLPFVTMDNDTTTEIDQAFYIERTKENGFKVYYAIAAVADYIKPGDLVHTEATKRGASYYLPGFSVSMLPAPLSEGVCSLNPNEPRRAYVTVMELNADGELIDSTIEHAVIESQAKLTYKQVDAHLTNSPDAALNDQTFADSLQNLRGFGLLREYQRELGGVEFYDRRRTEYKSDASSYSISKSNRGEVRTEDYNAELSILSNFAAGRFLQKHGVDGIYRVQPAISEEEEEEIKNEVNAYLKKSKVPSRFQMGPSESIANFLERTRDELFDRHREKTQRILSSRHGKSYYWHAPLKHAMLNLQGYLRESAPIRSIVEVENQRKISEVIYNTPVDEQSAYDGDIERFIDIANTSRQKQKKISREMRSKLKEYFE